MEMEVIEAEVRESSLPAVREDVQTAGTSALAALSDDEFTTRLAELKRGRDRIATIQRELMDKDVDYGTIPGTPKPTLYKPGAEKLCDIYGLRADFDFEQTTGDGVVTPTLAYRTRCELHLGSLDGPVVAVGYGSANSWERKHRYRRAERACPECGTVGALLRSKKGKAEWFCWAKKGGCGSTFPVADPRVVDQPLGDVENPDPWDLDTTLLKMSEKRSHVDATLRACAASGLFTQDLEDRPARQEGPPPPPEPTIAQAVRQRRSRAVTNGTGPRDRRPPGEAGSEADPSPGRPDTDEGGPTVAPRKDTDGPPHPADATGASVADDAGAPAKPPDFPPGGDDRRTSETPSGTTPAPPERCSGFDGQMGRCEREPGHPGLCRNGKKETWKKEA